MHRLLFRLRNMARKLTPTPQSGESTPWLTHRLKNSGETYEERTNREITRSCGKQDIERHIYSEYNTINGNKWE